MVKGGSVMRISILYIIMFVVIFFYFIYVSYLNPMGVTFQYFSGSYQETTLSILLVTSFFIGAFLLFFIYSIRDIRRALQGRKQKRETEQLGEIFYVATDALFKNDLATAEKQILTYLKRKSDDPNIYLKLAEIYQKGGKVKKAIETLEKAKELKKGQLDILFMQALLYKTTKDYPSAKMALKEIIALNPKSREALRELRDVYVEAKEFEKALKQQRKIVRMSPKGEIDQEKRLQQGLRYELAKFIAETGKEEEGIKEVKEMLKESPSFLPAQVLLGELFRQAGKMKDAIRVWQQGFQKTREVIFLSKLEDLYLSQEHPRGIINIYLEAMEKNPNNIVIPFFYARLCLRLEMIDEALEKLKDMESDLSDHPAYHYLLAEVYSHRGDYELAAGAYREGLRLEGGTYVPYRCTNCQKEIKNWLPLCPQCGQWGTFTACAKEEIKVPLAPLPSELMAWDF
jgi:lipopolysaccharide biosynthesis regulator YciM